MAERLVSAVEAAKKDGRIAFVPYVTGGFPKKEDTPQILLDLEAGGADIIELGVPFSDPLADGGTIQRASKASLDIGTTVRDCLGFVRDARSRGLKAPIVLMGYLNPFAKYGDKFVEDAAKAGVDGFIVVDLPTDEAASFLAQCDAHKLGFIPLVAPTTTPERMREVVRSARGYIYAVSITGVTGARTELPDDLAEFCGRVREVAGPKIPLAVGFGLSTREHVLAVSEFADAAVMGSAIIRSIENHGPGAIKSFVSSITGKI